MIPQPFPIHPAEQNISGLHLSHYTTHKNLTLDHYDSRNIYSWLKTLVLEEMWGKYIERESSLTHHRSL